jgi:hypothetical protein
MVLTIAMDQNPSSEAYSTAASHGIPDIYTTGKLVTVLRRTHLLSLFETD